MKIIIQRIIAIATVVFLSVGLNYATTLDIVSTKAADVGYHVLLIIYAIQLVVFLISYALKTEHYYDLTGGITYISVMVYALYQNPLQSLDYRSIVLGSLILLWAIRLSSFLFMRVKKVGKDSRFDKIKTNFTRFMLAWALQGFWVFMCTLPAITAIASESKEVDYFLIGGATLWVFGFLMEVISDRQKSKFNQDPKNKGKFMSTGFWALSRHPNYVGEVLLWTGIAVISLPTFSGWQYLALISPVFTYLLLTRVSGVNLLEASADKKWGMDKDYIEYKKKTSVFFPFL
jgi:steroid 5-alpha reductase family enzyme